MARHPDDVEVDVYPDMQWTFEGSSWSRMPGTMVAQEGGGELDTAGMVRTYGPQVGLATLALVSLLMMLRIVRKSSEVMGARRSSGFGPTDLSGDDEPLLTVGSAAVGQAETSESLLAGQEVDPDTLRFQELGREVSRKVEGNPEGAASLIRRWGEDRQ